MDQHVDEGVCADMDARWFPGCLWRADEQRRFIFLSSCMVRVFGRSLESLEDLADAAHPDDMAGHRAAIGGDSHEVRYRIAGGTYRWFEHSAGPAFHQTRRGQRVGVLIDIHERKLAGS
jgi:PAS domain-containing protein